VCSTDLGPRDVEADLEGLDAASLSDVRSCRGALSDLLSVPTDEQLVASSCQSSTSSEVFRT
jgi:hypothetical protein